MKFSLLPDLSLKIKLKPNVDSVVFFLHYRVTFVILMIGSLLTTLYDIIGDKINCLTHCYDDDDDDDCESYEAFANSYCLILGTFTVKHHHNTSSVSAHPGVGTHVTNDDLLYHTYYQWVPFVLFGLGILFYLPHWQWKFLEGGLFTNIIMDLSVYDYLTENMTSYTYRKDRFKKLANYLVKSMHNHRWWAFNFFLCEFSNLAVDVIVWFFIDWFLGNNFTHYGYKVIKMLSGEGEVDVNPLSYVFPKIAKCTLRMFGASGTIEIKDLMCLLPTNIVNEKMFAILWVWLLVLIPVTLIWIICRIVTLLSPWIRKKLLQKRAPYAEDYEINVVMNNVSWTDWFLLFQLGKNIEPQIFSEFISKFSDQLQPTETISLIDTRQE